MSKRGLAGQFVVVEIKAGQVDEHAEFGGDWTCQREFRGLVSKW
jgi:hypothetical protein